MKFVDLGLSPETLRAIEDVGYETPTPIQEKAIPHVLMGRDVLGIAQTGTGKTASFTLPMIEILANGRAKARMPRSLILAPTRELAAQVSENFTLYGKYHKLDMALLIGGESMGDQMRALDKGVDVLIATPGRLIDLFERGKVLLRDVKVLVIDEADRMLDMGFIPDVERIVSLLPPLRQTLFFSATMNDEIRKLADAFLSNPRQVSIERKATAAETVTQKLAIVPRIDKREALRHILRTENVRNAFIFCNRKRDVDVLNRSLKKHGFNCISLHGDMDQPTRHLMLRRFKDGEADLLVCSDVAARGLDIDDVSHVINFDIPTHSEDYVHRIGRTGRAGKEGAAYSLATPDDAKYVDGIEKLLGRPIPRLDLEGLDTVDAQTRAEHGEVANTTETTERGARRRRSGRSRGGSDDRTEQRAEQPKREDRPKREERPKRDDHVERSDQVDRPERRPTEDSGRSRRGRGRRDDARDGIAAMSHPENVLAFGDHTPAFFTFNTLVPMGPAVAHSGADEDEDAETGAEAETAEVSTDTERRSGSRGGRSRNASGSRGPRKGATTSRRGERKRHGRRVEASDTTENATSGNAVADAPEGARPEDIGTVAGTTEGAVESLSTEPQAVASEGAAPDAGAETGAVDSPDVAPKAPSPRRRRSATRRSSKPAETPAPQTADTPDQPASDASAEPPPPVTSGDVIAENAAPAGAVETQPEVQPEAPPPEAETPPTKPKRTRRKTTKAEDPAASGDEAPKPKRTRRKTVKAAEADTGAGAESTDSSSDSAVVPEKAQEEASPEVPEAKPKRTRRKAVKADDAAETGEAGEAAAKPKRTRRKTVKADDTAEAGEAEAKPKRTRRRTTKPKDEVAAAADSEGSADTTPATDADASHAETGS